jgi:hypothetical protein
MRIASRFKVGSPADEIAVLAHVPNEIPLPLFPDKEDPEKFLFENFLWLPVKAFQAFAVQHEPSIRRTKYLDEAQKVRTTLT